MNNKNTLAGLFESYTNQHPEHIAVLNGEQSLTYAELNGKANQLAHYLKETGVKPDMPIALSLSRSFDFIIAIIAILKAGGAYLPLDSSQPTERLLFLLNDSKAPLLITESVSEEKFKHYHGKLILLDIEEKNIAEQAIDNPQTILLPEHLAYVIYTSGSSGVPKGVLIEHRSIINYCQWFAEYTGCQPQQRIDFSSNPIFDMTVSVTLTPLILGLTIVICTDEIKKNTLNYLQHLVNTYINTIKLTPSYFKVLLHELKNDFIALPHLKSIILGGENLSSVECKLWLELYPEHILFNEYGPTETTVAISTYKVSSSSFTDFDANVPIGKPGSQINYIIVDEKNTPLPDGDIGELLIGGACLARGYLNQPELTQQQFIKDPFTNKPNVRLYKTGDLCRKRADGVLEYFGRMDDQVKIRGFRIEPGEIEQCLTMHPAIKTVAVTTQRNAMQEQLLTAYYIIKEFCLAPTTNELRQFLQNKVPEYIIPTAFIRIDCLPLTANGKLDKLALPLPRLAADQHYIEPITDLEKQLTLLWSEELGIQLIGLNDNFFELGGHSLSAARLVSKINHQLEKNITLQDFYQAACLTNLIPLINSTPKIEHQKNTLNKIKYSEITRTPLSDFQFVLWMSNIFEPKAKKLNIVARKRLHGYLDKIALEFAFQSLLKKHEVLIYRILKFKPSQQVQKNLFLQLIEENIESLTERESEQMLELSMTALTNFHSWRKDSPLIIGKLFYLRENSVELQICMPHLISDDASIDILFNDLSEFYLLYNKKQLHHDKIETDTHYKKYIYTERHAIESSLEKNTLFWENYLQDTSFFSFPKKYVVDNMNSASLSFSTYTKIPKQTINTLKYFCEQNHISINNGLSAILALALRNCCNDSLSGKPFKVMNIIKSTRDNPIYDHSVGCFLRVEPIKIALNTNSTLSTLSKQIWQSTIDTSNYQHCSNLIKFSAVSTLSPPPKKIQGFFIDLLTPICAKIMRIPTVYRKILQRSITRLMFFKHHTHFIINLNVRNNFIATSHKQKTLFGLKKKTIKHHQEELLAIDYIFEACFTYDDNQKNHYLVISANLKPEFKAKIAQEVIKIMEAALPEKDTEKLNHQDYQLV
ncbi:amino acid adenylation domain-containing protein [Legionella sp.]|uniref:amino acid adenylation domain-containing protein n=1 Tax=Legionella sp. TaxID=459 RepID=UPI003C9A4B74